MGDERSIAWLDLLRKADPVARTDFVPQAVERQRISAPRRGSSVASAAMAATPAWAWRGTPGFVLWGGGPSRAWAAPPRHHLRRGAAVPAPARDVAALPAGGPQSPGPAAPAARA